MLILHYCMTKASSDQTRIECRGFLLWCANCRALCIVSGFVFKGGRQPSVLRTPFQNMTDSAICKLFAPAKLQGVWPTHLQKASRIFHDKDSWLPNTYHTHTNSSQAECYTIPCIKVRGKAKRILTCCHQRGSISIALATCHRCETIWKWAAVNKWHHGAGPSVVRDPWISDKDYGNMALHCGKAGTQN